MKKTRKIFIFCLCAVAVAFSLLTVCIAQDWALYTGADTVEPTNKISYGLDVLANESKTQMSGLTGMPLNFSADKFACAMNLSRVDSITVVSLPDEKIGRLFLGSRAVSVGDVISGDDISRFSYEENKSGIGKEASFRYRVNSSCYDIECVIYMLDKVNASPTVEVASYASLNLLTYKGVSVSGVLAAHDPEGDGLVYEIVKYPSDGLLTLDDAARGIYTYAPDKSFTGDDDFVYVVKDQYGNYSSGIRVNIEVESPSVSVKYCDIEYADGYNYAIAMTELGVMNGERVGDNYYFRPDSEVSRVDFLVSAMKALGITSVPSAAVTPFSDDESIGAEQKGYVNVAYAKGDISGIKENGKTYLRPDDKITLSEAAVIVSNIIGYATPDIIPAFNDIDKLPGFAERAVISLYSLGIIECFDNALGADKTIDRGDMAKLLSRAVIVVGNM